MYIKKVLSFCHSKGEAQVNITEWTEGDGFDISVQLNSPYDNLYKNFHIVALTNEEVDALIEALTAIRKFKDLRNGEAKDV